MQEALGNERLQGMDIRKSQHRGYNQEFNHHLEHLELEKQNSISKYHHSSSNNYENLEGSIIEWENSYLKRPNPSRLRNHPSQATWRKSKSNFWKLNTDAAWFANPGDGGIGWSVHDSNGSLNCFG